MKIRVPKILPQYVPNEDIDRLLEGIKGKKSIERDVLLWDLRSESVKIGKIFPFRSCGWRLDKDTLVVSS